MLGIGRIELGRMLLISLMLLEDGLGGSDCQQDASEWDERTDVWWTGADGLHYWPEPRLFKQLAVLFCQTFTGSDTVNTHMLIGHRLDMSLDLTLQ